MGVEPRAAASAPCPYAHRVLAAVDVLHAEELRALVHRGWFRAYAFAPEEAAKPARRAFGRSRGRVRVEAVSWWTYWPMRA